MVEPMSALELVKWVLGIIIIPWLWFERRRVDSIRADMYTRDEVREQIGLRQQPLVDKLDRIHEDIKSINRNCKIHV